MIICADDFGMAPDVDEAIVQLARAGRVSAVSVMVAALAEPTPALRALLELRAWLDIGLHWVLTDEPGLAPSEHMDSLHRNGRLLTFGELLARSLAGGVRAHDAQRELAAQYAWFADLAESAPDFVAGHRHVQQFPGVRRGLVEFIAALPAARQPYVRNAAELTPVIFRRGVAPLKCWWAGLLGRALRARLQARGIATNAGFAGICDCARWRDYPRTLERMLQYARPGNYLIMTHPGRREEWRRAEFAGLSAAALPAGEPRRFARGPAVA